MTTEKVERTHRMYYLKWLIKDESGIKLTTFRKKWFTYYGSQSRSPEKVNINENIIFEKIGQILKDAEPKNKIIKRIDKDIIMDLLKQEESSGNNVLASIDNKIKALQEKQEKLLDMKLEDIITKEVYLEKYNKFESEIHDLKEEKKNSKDTDFEKKTQILLELAGSLYESYNSWNLERKTEMTKKLMLELIINNKKELQTRNSPLFKSSKMLNISFGIPTENWTPVSALRRPHPNH